MNKMMLCQLLLPDDLVVEILEHLPVKSLLRFRCVSNTWCSLIKSQAFINGHLRKERTNGTMMMTMSGPVTRSGARYLVYSSFDIDIPLTMSFHDVDCSKLETLWPNLSIPEFPDTNTTHWYQTPHLLGPCEGLICIVRLGSAYICNPAMKQFKLLPDCPFIKELPCNGNPFANGYFEMVFPDHWGFGTGSGNTFKVIRLQFITRAYGDARVRKTHVESFLYDSATDSWSKIIDRSMSLTFSTAQAPISELSFNGTCYWVIEPISDSNIPSVILSFEMNTEIFRQFECPAELRFSCEGSKNLMVYSECLSMVWFPWEESLPLEVWVMKESWTKQFVVDQSTLRRPLVFWKNDESLLMDGKEDGEMISYDLRTDESKSFQFDGVEDILSVVMYRESLISLD